MDDEDIVTKSELDDIDAEMSAPGFEDFSDGTGDQNS